MKKHAHILIILLVISFGILTGTADTADAATIASGTSGTCTWTIDSDYTLTVSAGTMKDWEDYYPPWVQYASEIRSVKTTGKVVLLSGSYLFYGCKLLEELDLSNFDTSRVKEMHYMFNGCSALKSLDLSGFNTSNATDMEAMFLNCKSLTSINMSGWNTQNVNNMWRMFNGCESLTKIDVSSFNTSKVTSMDSMFLCCKSLTSLDLSGFDTGNVINMNSMFYECGALKSLNLSGFNTSNVTDMSCMFENCKSLTSINMSGWNTQNVKDMSYMFRGCESLPRIDVSGFNTGSVTTMEGMFHCCDALISLDLSGFDTSNVTNMSSMINCYVLTSVNVSGFNTKKVKDMNHMFQGCWSLKSLDLSSFDTRNAEDMTEMFYGGEALQRLRLGIWSYGSITDDSKKPVFPIIMRDVATGLDYDAGEIVPEESHRTYKSISPENRTFKYYKTKGLYLRQEGFKSFGQTRELLNEQMDEKQSGPIPGIIKTYLNDGSAVQASSDYVPQGLCKFGDYYLVTSYEKAEKPKHSVIYVLDSSWNVVTTVTVGNYKFHNGGIAYDAKGDVIWLCGNTRPSYDGKPFVYGMHGSKLRDAISTRAECVHLDSFDTGNVYVNNKPSCLNYYNGRLWVGTCASSGSGEIIGYKTSGEKLDKNNRVSIVGVDAHMNGFTMGDNNELYASYSTGRNKMCYSIITRYKMLGSNVLGSLIILSDKRTVSVPRMNEEIMLDGKKLYVLYESGAKYYHDACLLTDRVTSLPTSLWDSGIFKRSVESNAMLGEQKSSAETIYPESSRYVNFSYQSSEGAEEINNTERSFAFTPDATGMYTISISGLTSNGDGNAYVTCEVTDEENYIGYASTAEYNYNEDDQNEEEMETLPFALNNSAECSLLLSEGHTYTITCTTNSMSPFDYEAYEAEESDRSYSGSYSLTVSGADSSVDDYSTDTSDGETVSMMTKEGEAASFHFVPEESGAYRVQCESGGALGDMIILKNMEEKISFNGEYCELEAGQDYYFIPSLSESDGVSSECEISMTITQYKQTEIAEGEKVPVSGDTILNYAAPESGKFVIHVTDGTVFNISVYDADNQMIATGDEKVVFEANANAPYRIECTGSEGDVHLSIEPYHPEMNDVEISNIKDRTYTGKSLTQSPVLMYDGESLMQGTDYTVTYKNNKKVGKATMTFTGKGDYTGTVTASFNINPKGTKLSKVTKAKKAATVKWKKQAAKMSASRIKGYQIQLATDSQFTENKKDVKVKGYSKTSKKVTKLKAGKKYYVRIRTYMKAGGATYYSTWSKTKSVK